MDLIAGSMIFDRFLNVFIPYKLFGQYGASTLAARLACLGILTADLADKNL